MSATQVIDISGAHGRASGSNALVDGAQAIIDYTFAAQGREFRNEAGLERKIGAPALTA